MKKKSLFLGLIFGCASLFILASCNNTTSNTSSTNTNIPSNSSVVPSNSSTYIPSSTSIIYHIEDNSIAMMAFDEYKKSFPDLTYDEFRLYGYSYDISGRYEFIYNQSQINIAKESNKFIDKDILIKDSRGNKSTSTYSMYLNDKWVKMKEFKYYGDEKLIVYNYSTFDYVVWLESTYEYDSQGKRTSEVCIRYVDGKGTRKTEYLYEDDLLKYTSTYKLINDEWVKTTTLQTTDGENYLIYEIKFDKEGNFDYKYEYEYNEDFTKVVKTESRYRNNEWVYTEQKQEVFDKETRIVSTYIVEYIDGTWTPKKKYDVTLDENWNRILDVVYKLQGDEWVNDYKYELTYDEDDNELSEIYSEFIDNEWKMKERTENTYDSDGNRLSFTYSEHNGTEWVYDYKDEYTYDERGYKATQKTYYYFEKGWVLTDEYVYTESSYFNDWYYKEVCSYEVDKNGDYTKETVYTYDDEWNVTAEITYKYVNGEWVESVK